MLRRTLLAVLACWFVLAGCETPPCVDGWVGAAPPDGHALYCVRKADDGRELRHGPYTSWYSNGQMWEQGEYLDGAREGFWTFWHFNGKVSKHGYVKAGKIEGRWIEYF